MLTAQAVSRETCLNTSYPTFQHKLPFLHRWGLKLSLHNKFKVLFGFPGTYFTQSTPDPQCCCCHASMTVKLTLLWTVIQFVLSCFKPAHQLFNTHPYGYISSCLMLLPVSTSEKQKVNHMHSQSLSFIVEPSFFVSFWKAPSILCCWYSKEFNDEFWDCKHVCDFL